jgi:predicted exporter
MAGPPLLRRLAAFARHRYRPIFAVAAVLVAVSVGLASRLRFDTDVLNLLPKHDPVIGTFLETLDRFGSIDYLLVVVRVPDGAALDPYETFVDRLGGRLEALPEIESVEYKLGDTGELLRELYPKAVLFLDRDERDRLAERLSDQGISERVREVRRQLSTPQGMAVKQILALDPFGLSELFLDRLQSSRGSLSVDWTSGYYLSRDHQLLLLLAKPTGPPQDLDYVEELVGSVERAIAAESAEWAEIPGSSSTRSRGSTNGAPRRGRAGST